MNYGYRNLLIIPFMFFSLSQQVSAIGEGFTKAAGDLGKTIGEGVSDVADSASDAMGVNKTAAEIDREADAALNELLKTTPAALTLSKTAKGILVFPKILKAGLMVGGQHGEGALKKNGKTVAYYNTVAGSYGFQAGAQSFSFAMFFMDDESLKYLNSSDGWEVGIGPSVVIVDDGMAKTMSSTTTTESVYVFTFSQGGLMAGAGIQGSKITQIYPGK